MGGTLPSYTNTIEEEVVRYRESPLRLEHDLARIRDHMAHRLPITNLPDQWYSSCRSIHGAIQKVNRRIGAMIFPQFLYEDGEDIIYGRLREAARKMIDLWKEKRAPVLAQWNGRTDKKLCRR